MAEQRKQFGTRYLNDESEVYKHNAWDNVEWKSEQEEEARNQIAIQKQSPVTSEEAEYLLQNPAEQWNTFYRTHRSKFFMNRNWLLTEFPELNVKYRGSDDPFYVLDVGCGVGNTTIPLLQASEWSGKMFVYACDYSQHAVDILKQNTVRWFDRCKPFVWDITAQITEVVPAESSTYSFFVETRRYIIIERLRAARYDAIEIQKNRLINENFYRRGDGTLVYFFNQNELDRLFTEVGLKKETNVLDRRLIVNRAKQVKMYRMWVECKYVKSAL
ncbi:Methyltransferase-like protein 2A [Dirofilaria immitis]|nr:Methyltransferase-like protein 2A [Dirofilaria immitis]